MKDGPCLIRYLQHILKSALRSLGCSRNSDKNYCGHFILGHPVQTEMVHLEQEWCPEHCHQIQASGYDATTDLFADEDKDCSWAENSHIRHSATTKLQLITITKSLYTAKIFHNIKCAHYLHNYVPSYTLHSTNWHLLNHHSSPSNLALAFVDSVHHTIYSSLPKPNLTTILLHSNFEKYLPAQLT